MKANNDVTEALQRTIGLMQGELERSVLSTQLLGMSPPRHSTGRLSSPYAHPQNPRPLRSSPPPRHTMCSHPSCPPRSTSSPRSKNPTGWTVWSSLPRSRSSYSWCCSSSSSASSTAACASRFGGRASFPHLAATRHSWRWRKARRRSLQVRAVSLRRRLQCWRARLRLLRP